MSKHRSSANRSVAGFTLIEALVATVLLGIVAGALSVITAQWLPNWNRGFSGVQRSELISIALERLAADVSAAEFVSANGETTRPLFEGTALALTFVRTAVGPNSRPGLEIVRIAETADRSGPALVRSRASFHPMHEATDQIRFADPVVLLRSPYRVSFSYAGEDRIWKDAWVNVRKLPSAVRMGIRDAATDRALTISTAVRVHAQIPAQCVSRNNDERRCGKTSKKPSGDNAGVPESDDKATEKL
jgi:general secretion pathway protein J